jgi:hypothetical protein
MSCLYYKDFDTGKIRRTFAKPVSVRRDGPLNEEGLLLENRASTIWIPRYCLIGASLAWFHNLRAPKESE